MHELKSMNSNLNEFQPCLLELNERKTTNAKSEQIEVLVISKDAVFERISATWGNASRAEAMRLFCHVKFDGHPKSMDNAGMPARPNERDSH
mmetsp:Transcript_38015/g.61047  ORF Transcript_38015/g.61047 Transcript_38015/m.61047 type:complete len:92 (+) Transcript_38015:1612-1887(+)